MSINAVTKIDSKRDLSAWCRASRRWYLNVAPILFTSLFLDLDHLSRVETPILKAVFVGIHRHAKSIRTLQIRTLDWIIGVQRLQGFFDNFPNFPTLKHFFINHIRHEALLHSAMRLINDKSRLLSLSVPLSALAEWRSPKSDLTSLELEDIYDGTDYNGTMTVPADFFAELLSLQDLKIDHASFANHIEGSNGPQLKHLWLRRPRNIGFIHNLCTKLETLILEYCSEEDTVQILSQATSLDTFQVQLEDPCVFSDSLVNALLPSASNVQRLWAEGPNRRGPSTGRFLQMTTETWLRLAKELSQLQTLSIDCPFARPTVPWHAYQQTRNEYVGHAKVGIYIPSRATLSINHFKA